MLGYIYSLNTAFYRVASDVHFFFQKLRKTTSNTRCPFELQTKMHLILAPCIEDVRRLHFSSENLHLT